ncbi:MAG: hypothetical protein INR71_03300 [Terriglobus roseus]|nr:hypothetical protein [Terriglobus roseus]
MSNVIEADSKQRQIFEMPGDMPAAQEAGGRQLSEKETMMVREARINGVGPPPPPPPVVTSPVSPDTGAPSPLTPGSRTGDDYIGSAGRTGANGRGTQRRQVQPGEVIELSPFERDNLTMGIVSPISGPGSSDGHPTNWPLSPLSPLGTTSGSSGPSEGGTVTAVGDGESPVSERARRRFSYE